MKPELTETIADRIKLAELFNRYADALDARDWEMLDGFYADDAVNEIRVAKGAEPLILRGPDAIIGFARRMIDSPELVTHHMFANFTAQIDGDEATATVHMRNHHAGVGSRAGLFQESLGTFSGHFVRNGDSWICTWWGETLFISLGDGEALFAPEMKDSAS